MKKYYVPENFIYDSASECLAAHDDQASTELSCTLQHYQEIQKSFRLEKEIEELKLTIQAISKTNLEDAKED